MQQEWYVISTDVIWAILTYRKGCNIRDIARVVQWKVPDALKAYTQRAGRVARDPLLTGLALLLAEPSAYQVDPIEPAAPKEAEGARRGQRSAVGRPRRSRGTKKRVDSDEIDPSNEPDVRQDSPGGGIYALVQTKKCRRGVIDKVFRNPNLPESKSSVHLSVTGPAHLSIPRKSDRSLLRLMRCISG